MIQTSFSFIGKGERVTLEILKHLTNYPKRTLKQFPILGIYSQVPLEWLVSPEDFNLLSDAHKKGSLDLVLVTPQRKIAIRVQGNGHGQGLKGLGKSKHDQIQRKLIQKSNDLVDILKIECKEIFKDRLNDKSIQELIDSFKTSKVDIPVLERLN